MSANVFLIPIELAEGSNHTIPNYVVEAVKTCQCFFVENERTARRFLKSVWKEMIIDDYEWFNIKEINNQVLNNFRRKAGEGKSIGIMSEAGCPGIADPGQALIEEAHRLKLKVNPLVGPSSVLLALIGSGMNGQKFRFEGYLPIESSARVKAIRDLESESLKTGSTQIFIETPYRNLQLFESLLRTCHPGTRLCVAVSLTAKDEWIRTETIDFWRKNQKPEMHKKPALFLIQAAQ